jgi:hypothetical protein
MRCEIETNNPYDPWAVLVKMPDGQTVGRVPAGLSQIFSQGLQNGTIICAESLYMGTMRHDGSRRGGGPKLNCIYVVEITSNIRSVADQLVTARIDTNYMWL